MSGTSPSEVWNSICTRADEAVRNANQQGEFNHAFCRFAGADGFSVSRQTPFLIVEKRFCQGVIHGATEHWDSNFVTKRVLAIPLRILDQNRLSTDDDKVVPIEDLIQGILKCFRDSTGRYTS